MNIFRYMLIFVPLAAIAEYLFHDMHLLIFLLSALALVALAKLLGEATEALAVHSGPRIGAVLTSTMANLAELIIAAVALREGNIELVKASLTGSIIGNLLLVTGASLLVGGLRHGIQRYDRELTSMSASMMTLAAIGLTVPTLFELLKEVADPDIPVEVFNVTVQDPQLNIISLGVALVLITVYVLSVIYFLSGGSQEAPSHTGVSGTEEVAGHKAVWSVKTALGILAVVAAAIVLISDFLVGVVEPVAHSLGVRQLFLGVFLVPLMGNVAENAVAVEAAAKNNMDLSLAISLGSSMQVALFVAPLLVFLGFLFGQTMTLFFSLIEVAVLTLSVIITAHVSSDGDSNWLEGSMLLAVWIIAGLGFFFIE